MEHFYMTLCHRICPVQSCLGRAGCAERKSVCNSLVCNATTSAIFISFLLDVTIGGAVENLGETLLDGGMRARGRGRLVLRRRDTSVGAQWSLDWHSAV